MRNETPVERHNSGFTLLEIMLVVVLIGITATFVVINLDRDPDQIAEQEAKRFMALIEHVRSEAILTGRTIGVEVLPKELSYRFLHARNGWTEITDDDILRPRFVPEFLSIDIKIEPGDEPIEIPDHDVDDTDNSDQDDPDGDEPDDDETKSYIIITTLGEITPFALRVRGEDYYYVVTLAAGQNLTLEQRDRKHI